MRRLTTIAVSVLLVILAIPFVTRVSTASSPAQLATPGIHYQTFTGRDFHTLDSDDLVRFAAGTGGGVWIKNRVLGGYSYLEAGVELPDGAIVTEVTFYVRNCELEPYPPLLFFGAYSPSSGTFTYFIPEFAAPAGACNQTQSIVQAVNSLVTVDNSQLRYVIGFRPRVSYNTDVYDSNFIKALPVGARLAYYAPGVFMPLIRR